MAPSRVALCTSLMLAAAASLATAAPPDASGDSAGPSTDHGLEALLYKAEQQIAAGHALNPGNDNALDTWLQVLARAPPGTPSAVSAVKNFASDMHSRAAEEESAGRVATSVEFSMFAGMADDYVVHAKDASAGSGPGSRQTKPETQAASTATAAATTTASAAAMRDARPRDATAGPAAPAERPAGRNDEAQAPPAASPVPDAVQSPSKPEPKLAVPASAAPAPPPAQLPASESVGPKTADTGVPPQRPDSRASVARADAAPVAPTAPPGPAVTGAPPPPPPAASVTAGVAPPPPPPTASVTAGVAPPPVPPDQTVAALYAARGDAMLAIKDVSAARRLYEFAANAGSARAAAALAATYDPAALRQLGAIGLRPDPALAAMWYRRAQALGDKEAGTRLDRLSREAQD